jgi:chromate reductase
VTKLAHAFHDWVDMIHRSRAVLADDAADKTKQAAGERAHA